ncbi:YnfU family zinc-binding protein [Edaphovirga cremea]|uniref:YnfU family zinc-binding protein n=1 Tax=Edaphovirga cremea TaxID=2267246 RepID=UPI001FE33CBD|nr:YnfU family zinc-binding protein [Edaphovirga cremea]
MSIFDAIRRFSPSSTKIACPKCAFKSEQQASKIQKRQTLICPSCGYYFIYKQ